MSGQEKPQTSATALLALLASIFFWACADLSPEPFQQCTSNASCDSGLTCQFERCAAEGQNRLLVHLQLTPRSADGLLTQHVAGVDLAQTGASLDITLVKSTLIRGTVRFESGALLSNVSGTLTARTDGEIPGLPHVFTTKSTGGQGFELAVLPGRDYKVTFRPSNKASPLHTFVWSAADTASDLETQVVLPDRSYVTVSGFAAWDIEQGPENATVAAYDVSGAKLSETTTKSWRGAFEMSLPPGVTQARLRIEAGEDEPLFATTWTPPMDVTTVVEVPIPPPQATRAVQLGVLGLATGVGETSSVPGATLSFELAGTALRATAETDAFGTASLKLLPGQYWVLVTPPEGSQFAAQVHQFYVDAGDEPLTQTVELAERPLLEGTVAGALGTPLWGTVTATRRPDAPNAEHGLTLSSKPLQLEVADGAFSQRVDEGIYDLKYEPPQTVQAPPQWLLAHHTDDGAAAINLQPAGVLAVVLRSPDGTPLPDAQVRIYMGEPDVGTREYSNDFTDAAGAAALPLPFQR